MRMWPQSMAEDSIDISSSGRHLDPDSQIMSIDREGWPSGL